MPGYSPSVQHDHEQPGGYDVNLRSGPHMREYREIVWRIRADAPRKILD